MLKFRRYIAELGPMAKPTTSAFASHWPNYPDLVDKSNPRSDNIFNKPEVLPARPNTSTPAQRANPATPPELDVPSEFRKKLRDQGGMDEEGHANDNYGLSYRKINMSKEWLKDKRLTHDTRYAIAQAGQKAQQRMKQGKHLTLVRKDS